MAFSGLDSRGGPSREAALLLGAPAGAGALGGAPFSDRGSFEANIGALRSLGATFRENGGNKRVLDRFCSLYITRSNLPAAAAILHGIAAEIRGLGAPGHRPAAAVTACLQRHVDELEENEVLFKGLPVMLATAGLKSAVLETSGLPATIKDFIMRCGCNPRTAEKLAVEEEAACHELLEQMGNLGMIPFKRIVVAAAASSAQGFTKAALSLESTSDYSSVHKCIAGAGPEEVTERLEMVCIASSAALQRLSSLNSTYSSFTLTSNPETMALPGAIMRRDYLVQAIIRLRSVHTMLKAMGKPVSNTTRTLLEVLSDTAPVLLSGQLHKLAAGTGQLQQEINQAIRKAGERKAAEAKAAAAAAARTAGAAQAEAAAAAHTAGVAHAVAVAAAGAAAGAQQDAGQALAAVGSLARHISLQGQTTQGALLRVESGMDGIKSGMAGMEEELQTALETQAEQQRELTGLKRKVEELASALSTRASACSAHAAYSPDGRSTKRRAATGRSGRPLASPLFQPVPRVLDFEPEAADNPPAGAAIQMMDPVVAAPLRPYNFQNGQQAAAPLAAAAGAAPAKTNTPEILKVLRGPRAQAQQQQPAPGLHADAGQLQDGEVPTAWDHWAAPVGPAAFQLGQQQEQPQEQLHQEFQLPNLGLMWGAYCTAASGQAPPGAPATAGRVAAALGGLAIGAASPAEAPR